MLSIPRTPRILAAALALCVALPAAAQPTGPVTARTETAVFAGGCFWGVEAVFEHVRGVKRAVSGYAGGSAATANYQTVTTGRTGHAEAVQVEYDPTQVSYGQLLSVFFTVAHDGTQLNRQGPDIGTHYRSAIFHATPAQKLAAQTYIKSIDGGSKRIVTELAPLVKFYPAEAYHQDFARLNPRHPYIVIHDAPKVRALRQRFPELYAAR